MTFKFISCTSGLSLCLCLYFCVLYQSTGRSQSQDESHLCNYSGGYPVGAYIQLCALNKGYTTSHFVPSVLFCKAQGVLGLS